MFDVINMSSADLQYVMRSIKSDIELNRELHDKDYSRELGDLILTSYLQAGLAAEAVAEGRVELEQLEERYSLETGKKVIFMETKRCGHYFCRVLEAEADRAELKNFAEELVRSGKQAAHD